jgi:hypothetical protein
MTRIQRLLALEAALCGAECCFMSDPQARKSVTILQNALMNLEESYPSFGDFIDAQKEAVKALASNPQVFGGDPDKPPYETPEFWSSLPS